MRNQKPQRLEHERVRRDVRQEKSRGLRDGVPQKHEQGRRRLDDVFQLRKQRPGEHSTQKDVEARVEVEALEHLSVDAAERRFRAFEEREEGKSVRHHDGVPRRQQQARHPSRQ